MSQVEFRIGKIKEVAKEMVGFEEKVRHVIKEFNVPIETIVCAIDSEVDWRDEYVERDSGFVYANKKMFKILEDKDIEEDIDLCEIKNCNLDEYEYRLRYYNGGTYFEEMLGEALNKLK